MRTEASDYSGDPELSELDLEAEERIEKIAAPSYLKFDGMAEPGFDQSFRTTGPGYSVNTEICQAGCEEEEETDHFLDLQNSENSTRIFLSDIEQRQTEIKWWMRALLFDWLIEVA